MAMYVGPWESVPGAYARAHQRAGSIYAEFPKGSFASPEAFAHAVPQTDTAFLRTHAHGLSQFPEAHIRYLVSVFDAAHSDELFLLAQRTDALWDTVGKEIEAEDPIVALLSVPLFWQMGPMFYHTCRSKKIPVSVLSPRNLPLARQLIKEVDARYVATTADVAQGLYDLLMQEGMGAQIRHWHIISTDGIMKPLEVSGRVSYEWHLFPGIPFAYCSSDEKKSEWQVLPQYACEHDGVQCVITTTDDRAVPLVRFVVPYSVEHVPSAEGVCVRRI